MTVNEALAKQNFLNKILLRYEKNELSKELKVKLMGMRIALSKIRAEVEEDAKKTLEDLKPEGFSVLGANQNRTPEEEILIKDFIEKLTIEYQAIMLVKGKEEVNFTQTFTEDEFEQIVKVNANNNVDINGTSLEAAYFLEIIHSLFVEE